MDPVPEMVRETFVPKHVNSKIAPLPGPSKRKREFVQHVKDTLKRSCLAKIQAKYKSVTVRRQKLKPKTPAELQQQTDSFESTVAKEIDNCRHQLDKVRRNHSDLSIASNSPQKILSPIRAGGGGAKENPVAENLLATARGGAAVGTLSESEEEEEEEGPPPKLQWYEEKDLIGEEEYTEIMAFLEESILKEFQRHRSEEVCSEYHGMILNQYQNFSHFIF